MPRGDGTGPLGMGPMSGRGLGFCAGYNTPGYMYGRGMRRFSKIPCAYVPIDEIDEKEYLKNAEKVLEKKLSYVKKRLGSLEEE
ncbi:MAG TPA: DUF5320 domain-containing protein [Clostridiaceae bacterium]|jgi:hypothetical protein|nr:DUF5320 domain-containing protein [Clostridiaceae bacterium]